LLSWLTLTLIVFCTGVAVRVAPASASTNQESIFQDDAQLKANPIATLSTLRSLGVARVRVSVTWASIAPSPGSSTRPARFDAANPAAYPTAHWRIYDTIVKDALADGIGLDFTLTGPAPLWATGAGAPAGSPRGLWKPSAHAFGSLVTAVAKRYSGSFDPTTGTPLPGDPNDLPKVSYWGIWNEPNYGPYLAPQATDRSTVEVSPALYRGLVDAAWSALHANGHRSDTILIGELAPRGITVGGQPGNFGGMVPLRFLRALYCVDGSYNELRGSAAAARACPRTAAGSRKFAAANPGLFKAGGFADHPNDQGKAPTVQTWPNPGVNQFTDLPQLPALEHLLDRLQRIYGSHTQFKIYSTEYGYRTSPPGGFFASPAQAAVWLNEAEYISWRNPRVSTYMQYELQDPPGGNYPTGLETKNGIPKATYAAYRIPIYLPVTRYGKGRRLEVWGCVRPAHYATVQTGVAQHVQIQLQRGPHTAFQTIKTVRITNSRGYFDVSLAFPSRGTVRLAWTNPTGHTDYSRLVNIRPA
jgi:hypothetical protein